MTPPLFRKVDCLSIPVPDLDAAVAFYSANLGHELIWRSRTAAGLRLPASNAELVLHTQDRPMETDLAVDSVPEALTRFTAAGGTTCSVILDASKGPLRLDENKRVIDGWDNCTSLW